MASQLDLLDQNCQKTEMLVATFSFFLSVFFPSSHGRLNRAIHGVLRQDKRKQCKGVYHLVERGDGVWLGWLVCTAFAVYHRNFFPDLCKNTIEVIFGSLNENNYVQRSFNLGSGIAQLLQRVATCQRVRDSNPEIMKRFLSSPKPSIAVLQPRQTFV